MLAGRSQVLATIASIPLSHVWPTLPFMFGMVAVFYSMYTYSTSGLPKPVAIQAESKPASLGLRASGIEAGIESQSSSGLGVQASTPPPPGSLRCTIDTRRLQVAPPQVTLPKHIQDGRFHFARPLLESFFCP